MKFMFTKYWASADLLFLINNISDAFYIEGLEICSEYVLYTLLVETIPTGFVD